MEREGGVRERQSEPRPAAATSPGRGHCLVSTRGSQVTQYPRTPGEAQAEGAGPSAQPTVRDTHCERSSARTAPGTRPAIGPWGARPLRTTGP